MDNVTLRKVQLQLLEILLEIDRVCQKHGIQYFLDSGTLLGAIRHKGFIPWDDDMDIGMLRSDYERFNKIAQKELGDKFIWQTWDTDPGYPIPFGKVRKKGTLYVESKAKKLKENGFYVDVLPYDFAPNDIKIRNSIKRKQHYIFRCLLMKCGYKPWNDERKLNIIKRLGYIPYSIHAFFLSKETMIERYMKTVVSVNDTDFVYEQTGKYYYDISWMQNTVQVDFESFKFPAVKNYHEWLTRAYGDYMTLPPVETRENRHQIIELDFGE